jgi:hypothetical protein
MTGMDIDLLLQNPFFLQSALLKAVQKTQDKEILELQKALLKVNFDYILLRQKNFELNQTVIR